uniref:DDE Tnp4 domain-containing protein n=1 Tax=Lactuca sativa TaxID=4236 RepID=A0A9R1UES0_LACSA|nr:hypothetical protein LSAT_V11C900492430 [Lactuca sativa]
MIENENFGLYFWDVSCWLCCEWSGKEYDILSRLWNISLMLFAEHQEAARKDVERAFGVLQACFAFLQHPCLLWDKDMVGKLMILCIIIHNMIMEDERCIYLHYYDPSEFLNDRPTNRKQRTYIEDDDQNLEYSTQRIVDLSSYMTNRP